jgi:hypothetical protein
MCRISLTGQTSSGSPNMPHPPRLVDFLLRLSVFLCGLLSSSTAPIRFCMSASKGTWKRARGAVAVARFNLSAVFVRRALLVEHMRVTSFGL